MSIKLNYYSSIQKGLLENAKLYFIILVFLLALVFTSRQLFVFSSEFAEFAQSKDSNFNNQANELLEK